MIEFLIIIEVALFLLMIILGAINLSRPNISVFELKKRGAKDEQLLVSNNYHFYNSLKNSLYIIIVVTFTIIMLRLMPGFNGYALTLAMIYIAYLLSTVSMIQSGSRALTKKIQKKIISFLDKHHKTIKYFIKKPKEEPLPTISSNEELEEIISTKGDFLSADQKKLITNGLSFFDKPIKELMIKRPGIVSIKGSEILGPLTLDKLYQSRQDYALVIGKNIDEVKGVLPLNELLIVESDSSTTKTAIKSAKKPAYYILQSSSLGDTLKTMLKDDNEILVVTDKNNNTVGLVTLRMLCEFLLV